MKLDYIKGVFASLDVHIVKMLQSKNHGYDGAKPSPEDWEEIMLDKEFLKSSKEFMIINRPWKHIFIHLRCWKTLISI